MVVVATSLAIMLKRLRQAQGLTQTELAERAGVSMRTISDIERGISRFPHRDTVVLIAQALRLSEDDTDQLLAAARGSVQNETEPSFAARMPIPVTPLIGREDDLALAEQAISSQARVLTLLGPAGVGKTRLAVALGERLAARLPGGVFFVDLAQLTAAEQVTGEIARTMEIQEERGVALADTVAARLEGRDILLILDNCEQIAGIGAFVAALMAYHRLHLVITSRIALNVAGERVMRVSGLTYPAMPRAFTPDAAERYAAVQLFVSRAQAAQPEFILSRPLAPYVARICAALQGIPLAIELAAAQARVLSVADIARQLTQRHATDFLGWLAPRSDGIPRRQQSLEDAIAWSYRLLDAPAQVMFRRLCVFAGTFDTEAIITVCAAQGDSAGDPLDAVLRLVDHQLVQPVPQRAADGAPRFVMLDAIRSFGVKLLQQRQEMALLQRRHAEYYAALIGKLEQEFSGTNQAEVLARITDDYDNLIAAMQWAKTAGDAALGLHLVAPLWWYWEKRRTLSEGREWLESMLALCHEGTVITPRLLSRVLYGAAILASMQGDLPGALRSAEDCLANAQRDGEANKVAQIQTLLGTLYQLAGDHEAAIRYLRRSLQGLREQGERRQISAALNNLGTLLIEQGQLAEAAPLLEEALALKREQGDQRGVAVTLINLSEILKQQGEYERALAAARQAGDAFARMEDHAGMAMALNNQGEIDLARNRPADALEHARKSLTLFEQSENRLGCAMAWRTIGDIYEAMDQPERATQAWRASLEQSIAGPHAEYCRRRLETQRP